jgi:hypothetical protein
MRSKVLGKIAISEDSSGNTHIEYSDHTGIVIDHICVPPSEWEELHQSFVGMDYGTLLDTAVALSCLAESR